ncbi:hypothetical protein BJ875DRAFT_4067 [Amylocarpus encephaloides]|uniref:Uncharacterized protein n=1 Tax=Amylocarpus encephaloides TaxID=45428 RepID=A0A9P7YRU5_9HELO|nr:hypothetical protein BJ875DRAFT_4067 [Amylocarpus encephaloides]
MDDLYRLGTCLHVQDRTGQDRKVRIRGMYSTAQYDSLAPSPRAESVDGVPYTSSTVRLGLRFQSRTHPLAPKKAGVDGAEEPIHHSRFTPRVAASGRSLAFPVYEHAMPCHTIRFDSARSCSGGGHVLDDQPASSLFVQFLREGGVLDRGGLHNPTGVKSITAEGGFRPLQSRRAIIWYVQSRHSLLTRWVASSPRSAAP